MRNILTILFAFIASHVLAQQDTLFWFAAPNVKTDTYQGGQFEQPIQLGLTSFDEAATVTVSVPADSSFESLVFELDANVGLAVDLTPWRTLLESIPHQQTLNNGLMIHATSPIFAYYEVNSGCACDSEFFSLKGSNGLGKHFIIPAQVSHNNHEYSGGGNSANAGSSLDIVATEDGTQIEIVLSSSISEALSLDTIQTTLNRGQVFSFGDFDTSPQVNLNGTEIICSEEVAVTYKDDVLKNSSYGGCSDLGGDQLYPVENAGQNFIAIGAGQLNYQGDRVIITGTEDNTSIQINNVTFSVDKGQHFEYLMAQVEAARITSNKPIVVGQLSGFGCEIGYAVLPPTQCNGSQSVNFFRSTTEPLYFNIISKTEYLNSFTIDEESGVIVPNLFDTVPNTYGDYSFATVPIPLSSIGVNSSATIINSEGKFHLGVLQGTATGSCRFGYFSNFGIDGNGENFDVCLDTLTVSLQDSLLLYLPFDNGQLIDQSNYGRAVENPSNASPGQAANGQQNSAWHLNGIDEFLEITSAPELEGGAAPFTFCLEYQSHRLDTAMALLTKFQSSAQKDWGISILETGQLSYQSELDEDNDYCRSSASNFNDMQEWHSLIITTDLEATSIYVDGTLVATEVCADFSEIAASTSTPVLIGKIGYQAPGTNPERFFKGNIDNVRVYNRILNKAEIFVLAQSFENTNVFGCTDPLACNYEEENMIELDDCVFPFEFCDDGADSTEYTFLSEDCNCEVQPINLEILSFQNEDWMEGQFLIIEEGDSLSDLELTLQNNSNYPCFEGEILVRLNNQIQDTIQWYNESGFTDTHAFTLNNTFENFFEIGLLHNIEVSILKVNGLPVANFENNSAVLEFAVNPATPHYCCHLNPIDETDNTHEWVEVAIPPNLSSSASMTLEGWFQYETLAKALVQMTNLGAQRVLSIGINNNKLDLWDVWNEEIISNTIDVGWHHFAYVYSNGIGNLYVDGNHVGNHSASFSLDEITILRLGILQNVNGTTQFNFKGKLDEFRLWKDARTIEEIKQWMLKSIDIELEDNLEACWHFDHKSSQNTFLDCSGNQNHASIINEIDVVISDAPVGDNRLQHDLELIEILSPTNGCGLGDDEVVEARVRNAGIEEIDGFQILVELNGQEIASQPIQQVLHLGAEMSITLENGIDLSEIDIAQLVVNVVLEDDDDESNNQQTLIIESFPEINSSAEYSNVLPSDEGMNVSTNPILSWSPIQSADLYDVKLWLLDEVESDTMFFSNIEDIQFNIQNLAAETEYGWQILARSFNCPDTAQSEIFTFTTKAFSDLFVDPIEPPQSIIAGANGQIEVTIINNGMESTGSDQWNDIMLISLDDMPNAGDLILSSQSNEAALLAGEGYTYTADVTWPNLAGEYYLIILTDYFNSVMESDEINNVFVEQITVDTVPVPDLIIEYPLFGNGLTNAFSGDSYPFECVVKNNSTGFMNNNYWITKIEMSESPVYEAGNGIGVGLYQHTSAIFPEDSILIELQITIPNTTESGIYYLHAITDPLNDVYEQFGEGNNFSEPVEIDVVFIATPDLQVSVLNHPNEASNNEQVTFTYEISNAGVFFQSEEIQTNFYLVNGLGAQIPIGSSEETLSMQTDETILKTYSFQAPGSIFGDYQIKVHINGSDNLFEYSPSEDLISNNIGLSNDVTILNADLEIENLVVETNGFSGQFANLSFNLLNVGEGDVINENLTVNFYISESTFENAISIGSLLHFGNIGSSSTVSFSENIMLPQGLEGTYTIFAEVNGDQSVFENGESVNNLDEFQVALVLPELPDLGVDLIQTTSDFYLVGETIEGFYLVSNGDSGVVVGQNWVDQIAISTSGDAQDAQNIIVHQDFQVNELVQSGEMYQVNFEFDTSVSDFVEAEYFIHVVIDFEDQIFESNGDNGNVLTYGPVYLNLPSPMDLKVDFAQAQSTEVIPGEQIQIEYGFSNVGESSSQWQGLTWKHQVKVSTDTINSWNDEILDTEFFSAPLSIDLSNLETITVQMPNELPEEFFLLVVLDPDEVTLDPTTNNTVSVISLIGSNPNEESEPITPVEVFYPDYATSNFEAPSVGIAGQEIAFSAEFENFEDIIGASDSIAVKLFLSTDLEVGNGDLTLGTYNISTPNQGEVVFLSGSCTLPIPDSQLNFFLIIKVDANNLEYEPIEQNNLGFSPLSIVIPPPGDLIVSVLNQPDTCSVGEAKQIVFKTENIGENPIVGSMKQINYLSADSILDPYDLVLSEQQVQIGLSPNSIRIDTMGFEVPGVPMGLYYVFSRTDVLNNFDELDENNNIGSSPNLTYVTLQELYIGISETTDLENEQEKFYRISIADSLFGESMRVSLEKDSLINISELYVSEGEVPSRAVHDFASNQPNENYKEIIEPFIEDDNYYVLAYGDNSSVGSQTVELLAEIIPFEITSINSNVGGNSGNFTTLITGGKFEADMEITLSNGTFEYDAISTIYLNATEMYVTFDLFGAELGAYDVIATKQNGEARALVDGFTIVEGSALYEDFVQITGSGSPLSITVSCSLFNSGSDELFIYALDYPSQARARTIIPLTFHWRYVGNVDISVPTIPVYSISGEPLSLDPNEVENGDVEITFQLREEDGPPNIVRPGAEGSITFYTIWPGSGLGANDIVIQIANQ